MTKEIRNPNDKCVARSGARVVALSSFAIRHSSLLLIAVLIIGAGIARAQDSSAQPPDTIKIGPLKPLETLPSLSPKHEEKPSEPKPAALPAAPPAAPTVPPPLPTTKSLIITGPVFQGYLYVEAYQTRFEVLFDAATVMAWLSPGQTVPKSLTPADQAQLTSKAAGRADDWCRVSVGNQDLQSPQPIVSVIKGLPGNTFPLKQDEEVPLNEAMVGFMWEFATPPSPDELTVTWKGWIQGATHLPVRVFFGSLSETADIHSAVTTMRWRSGGRLPRPSPLAAVPQFEVSPPWRIPVGAIAWLVAGAIFYAYMKFRDYRLPGGSMPYLVVWLLGAALMRYMFVIPVRFGAASPVIADAEAAQKIVVPLMRNVYRAFDHRVESEVYDVLARSVDGELLRKLYLETIQALTLEGREGTRVTIAEFQLSVDQVARNPKGDGFVADCNWMARGIVGHWGHSHPRVNIYNARITVTPNEGEWKLTGLEVQEVRRL